jgi:hypothetical protein
VILFCDIERPLKSRAMTAIVDGNAARRGRGGADRQRAPQWRHHPDALEAALFTHAHRIDGNAIPPLSTTDTSPEDVSGVPCVDSAGGTTSGYCHLGGEAIEDNEAYGAGLVDAARSVHH